MSNLRYASVMCTQHRESETVGAAGHKTSVPPTARGRLLFFPAASSHNVISDVFFLQLTLPRNFTHRTQQPKQPPLVTAHSTPVPRVNRALCCTLYPGLLFFLFIFLPSFYLLHSGDATLRCGVLW